MASPLDHREGIFRDIPCSQSPASGPAVPPEGVVASLRLCLRGAHLLPRERGGWGPVQASSLPGIHIYLYLLWAASSSSGTL